MKTLKGDNVIIIKGADKGGSTLIINKEDYKYVVEIVLNDEICYTKLNTCSEKRFKTEKTTTKKKEKKKKKKKKTKKKKTTEKKKKKRKQQQQQQQQKKKKKQKKKRFCIHLTGNEFDYSVLLPNVKSIDYF